MENVLSRRSFLRCAASASGVLLVGFDADARVWVAAQQARSRPFDKLPPLDGLLTLDEAARAAVSEDAGLNFRGVPAAVLRPGSVDDVVRMVRFANRHGIPIAVRGQAHSQYGQSLVEDGILVESAHLNAVHSVGARAVDAQAGATWADVTAATLAAGRTPLVMPDVMALSVGGMLSVGGWGNTSHRLGSVADTVEELEVVTGDGRRLTCSPREHAELFEMTLVGLGQVALIVRARLRLEPAPRTVVTRELVYDDLGAYVKDAARLAREARCGHQGAKVLRREDGNFEVRLQAGVFAAAGAEPDLAALDAGLTPRSRSDVRRTPYAEYLQREAGAAAVLQAGRRRERRRSASLAMFLPASAAESFTARVLASPVESGGIWRIDFSPFETRRFTRPLFRLPDVDLAFALWLFRSVPAAEPETHAHLMAANAAIRERLRGVGGKVYPPYVAYTQADWREHYGEAAWGRLAAAKRRFDPAGVLTPGPRMFPGSAGAPEHKKT